MRVLIAHNRYQQKGGEDSVVASEIQLLTTHGVEVEYLEVNNDDIHGLMNKVIASARLFYSFKGVRRLKNTIARSRPDVVHVHNWFPSLSASVFGVCNRGATPVVHTLHNYRLLCVKGSLYRNGGPCEDCIGTALRLPGIVHGCYRGSHAGSAVATAAMLMNWRLGTWSHAVDRFIALSHFAKSKLVEGGLPEQKVVVKPNSLATDPGVRAGAGGYFAYVGRLSEEKGIPILLECWRRGRCLPQLRIAGSGPLEEQVRSAAATLGNVEWLGTRSSGEVMNMIGDAQALICPSCWYEGMPRVVIEAMAVGTPVLASRLGTFVELIDHGRTGMLFESGQPDALMACVNEFTMRVAISQMRTAARKRFDSCYSAEANYRTLLRIYQQAIATRSLGDGCVSPVHAA